MITLTIVWFIITIWLNMHCYSTAKTLGPNNKFEFFPFQQKVYDKYHGLRMVMNFISFIFLISVGIALCIIYLP